MELPVTLLYDGSFEGLLSSVFESFHSTPTQGLKHSRILSSRNLQFSVAEDYRIVISDKLKADKVEKAIREKLSSETLFLIYDVFLSEREEAATLIRDFLVYAFRHGRGVLTHLTNDTVDQMTKISLNLRRESHKYTGFVRFRQISDGLFYSAIHPKNNVLELLAPHFADRMRDMCWMIHDTGRGFAAVYDRKNWFISENVPDSFDEAKFPEDKYIDLWKEFYRTIGIESRYNPNLRRSLMPKRYWDNITEMR
jgi:probable DNA metabolism protein